MIAQAFLNALFNFKKKRNLLSSFAFLYFPNVQYHSKIIYTMFEMVFKKSSLPYIHSSPLLHAPSVQNLLHAYELFIPYRFYQAVGENWQLFIPLSPCKRSPAGHDPLRMTHPQLLPPALPQVLVSNRLSLFVKAHKSVVVRQSGAEPRPGLCSGHPSTLGKVSRSGTWSVNLRLAALFRRGSWADPVGRVHLH